MKVLLVDFTVPNFVRQQMPTGRRQDGFQELPSYALSEIPAEDLAELCTKFRAAIFAKAKKQDPGRGEVEV